MTRRLVRALVLLLLAPTASIALTGSSEAAPQPCTVTYSRTGGPIRVGPDAGKDHSWNPFTIEVADSRQVVDLDISYTIDFAAAQDLSVHLLGPKSGGALVPSVQTLNRGMATGGALTGTYTFDDEAGTRKVSGATNGPGTYFPATPASGLEDFPAVGSWSLWVLNYSSTVGGTLSSFSLTLTYATCDTDGDGVEDKVDNCVTTPNADQSNRDDDALGDACDLDSDGDGLAEAADGCPTVASSTPTGCPTAPRTAKLRWLDGRKRLQATVSSPVAACEAGARITLWKVRVHRDTKLLAVDASVAGRYRFKVPRGARYRVTVSSSYSPGQAECGKAVSRKVRVPRH
ncbi:thrombospondin type 3 repeat-containing protein [Nocardioides cavernae]|uniref:thrombospondin type 3 repeat-containing protein n=1 Tax=Nocardioides TaxID=1839 RepID=UPI000AD53134|nr:MULTISPECIES: thrombospondin type 3 repeat-containing protein [Nocardioides]MCK9825385.1 thrombospondin type 3 repeat-containing protein [Nocardioides cavernae]